VEKNSSGSTDRPEGGTTVPSGGEALRGIWENCGRQKTQKNQKKKKKAQTALALLAKGEVGDQ